MAEETEIRVWADGRLRFSGETRAGFDSITGKRTRGRPRKLPANSSNDFKCVDGVFTRLIVRIIAPRLEHYIADEKVAYVEITDTNTTLVLKDSSRVKV